MASVAMLIEGALANALASKVVVICSIDYQRTASIKKERDTMRQ